MDTIEAAPKADGGDPATIAALYPSMATTAPEVKSLPTRDELNAAKWYPGMAQEKPGEPPKPAVEPAQPEATPEATAFAEALAEKIEGLDVSHADTVSFATVAAEIGITPDDAARLAEWDAQRTDDAWNGITASWQAEAKQSPTFDEDLELGTDLITRFGSSELRQFLVDYRAGNNPHLIKLLGNIGRAMQAKKWKSPLDGLRTKR